MKRHPDGRFRGNRSSIQITTKLLISRWVEREVIRLKRMPRLPHQQNGLLQSVSATHGK